MITRFKCKKIILPDTVASGYVYISNGRIRFIGNEELPYNTEVDCGENYLSPGFIDLHVHGGAGYDFGSCSAEEAQLAAAYHLSHGTTTLLPTLAAAPLPTLAKSIERLRPWLDTTPGVHLEGPYFSKKQCGAQNTDFITAPNPKEYQDFLQVYGAHICRWSYAPELDDGSFCKALISNEIIPSAGHSDAVGSDIDLAYRCGLRLITHLYSCTSTITRLNGYRRIGIIESAFLHDDISVELIADGAHLPDQLLQMTLKIKGREHIALITDALSVTGSSEKMGILNGTPYIIEDNVCKLPDRSAFAGSIATADRLIRNCMNAGISLVDSVYMMSTTPAALLNLHKGRIAPGMDADLLIFDSDIRIKAVYLKGQKEM